MKMNLKHQSFQTQRYSACQNPQHTSSWTFHHVWLRARNTSAPYCKFNHWITTERELIFNSWFRKRLKETYPRLISESIQSIKSLAQQASQNLKKVSSYPIKKIQFCLSILNIGLITYQETACKSTIKPRPSYINCVMQ